MSEQLTPAQRNGLFQRLTKKTQHTIGKQTVTDYAEPMTFTYPKTSLLSRTLVMCTATFSIKNTTSSTISLAAIKNMSLFKMADIVRRVTIANNKNQIPFSLSGGEACLFSALKLNNDHIKPSSKNSFYNITLSTESLAASSSATLTVNFLLDLQNVLNDENLSGLFLLEKEDRQWQLTLDFNSPVAVFGSKYGTVTMTKFEAIPTMEAFTIPATQDAFPTINDIKRNTTELKTLHAGMNQLALTCGDVYRKIILLFEDDFDVTADITSNIELVLGVDTYLYQVDPITQVARNQAAYGFPERLNAIIFDFSDQGLPNFGSFRDYINTEGMTEFWVKFVSSKSTQVRILTEQVGILTN